MDTRNTVWFDTAEFEFSHGKTPRGIGMWAFDFGRGPEFTPDCCSFTDAKRWAKKQAQARRVSAVAVCP